jgi:cytochrome c peroxidase
LQASLDDHGFTGRIGTSLTTRLGRPVNLELADLGRHLWFDPIGALSDDNSCSGCHSPSNGFGDTQSIAIGVDNNDVVGPGRSGPRNQRRSPMVINTAFYPTLMWNSRFRARSGDPFDNRGGLEFPMPEGMSLSHLPHLLTAQAFIPPTERPEAAGFDFHGNNDDMRNEVARRIDGTAEYRRLFGLIFPEVEAGGAVTFTHVAHAIAEFEFSLVFADAPIDRYARGDLTALTSSEKHGAVLFFGPAGCVRCHQVGGASNEMFSDFREHNIGVPQVAPSNVNVTFDGPGANEDFGLAQVTGSDADRYRFRSSPLRNVSLQPAFMHNGAFVTLEAAIRHHLDVETSARGYSPAALAPDLRGPVGPIEPVLVGLDPLVRTPIRLSETQFDDLVAFVRNGLLDPRAKPTNLRSMVPVTLPSGNTPHRFEF